jgi:hypothetical protein
VGAARIVILHEFGNHFFDPSGIRNVHWGNVRFRALVDAYAERYRLMSPQQKRHLIATLVQVASCTSTREICSRRGTK